MADVILQGDTLGLRAISHPLRAALSEEMHVRKLPMLTVPSRLMQLVVMTGEKQGDASRDHSLKTQFS